MIDAKGFLSSKTIWGAIIVIVSATVQQAGFVFSEGDQTATVTAITTVGEAFGALMAIYGRVVASKRIGS